MDDKYVLRIYRGSPGNQYWQEFELSLVPLANVVSSLMEIQKRPVTREGNKVEPVTWEQGCLEEVCGSCSMLINGKPRQACTALIAPIIEATHCQTITVAPLSKFPLVRDLIVDRSVMFDNLKKIKGWIDADGTYDRGFGPKMNQETQELRHVLSTCMTCGCCVEACPQINEHSKFVGPQIIAQVELFNMHPTGRMNKKPRLQELMKEGGISDCGNAQNCVRVCPKNIPLTDAIAAAGRDVTLQALEDLFGIPGRD
jgi:succinate dehydrogenase / fumarate reductase iron-sulfur subunit